MPQRKAQSIRCSATHALSTAKRKQTRPAIKGSGAASSEAAAVAALASVTPALPPPYHSSPNHKRTFPEARQSAVGRPAAHAPASSLLQPMQAIIVASPSHPTVHHADVRPQSLAAESPHPRTLVPRGVRYGAARSVQRRLVAAGPRACAQGALLRGARLPA